MEKSWRERPASGSNGTPSGSANIGQAPYSIRNNDISRAEKAVEEGRRIYVGNLPYEALTGDVEKLFTSNQFTMFVPFSQPRVRINLIIAQRAY